MGGREAREGLLHRPAVLGPHTPRLPLGTEGRKDAVQPRGLESAGHCTSEGLGREVSSQQGSVPSGGGGSFLLLMAAEIVSPGY